MREKPMHEWDTMSAICMNDYIIHSVYSPSVCIGNIIDIYDSSTRKIQGVTAFNYGLCISCVHM